MKKKIPKFDQKAWDEKQAKVAEEANGNSGLGFRLLPIIKQMSKDQLERMYADNFKKNQDWLDSHTYGRFLPSVPKNKLSAQFPPNIGSEITTTPGHIIYHDQYDNLIFNGGEDGERDKDLRLPQGHNDGSWYSYDPAFKQEERCCKPEDKVNIGFMMDKWACKVCGKDM